MRDVSEKQTLDIAPVGGEDRLRFLLDGLLDHAIAMLDTQGRIASWNTGAERLTGYRAEEVLGKHFSISYEPHDQEAGKPARALQTVLERGRFEEDGWRLRNDGSRMFVNEVINPLHDESGALRGYAHIMRDITSRHSRGRVRHDFKERLRLAVESVQEYAILVLDPQGCITTWNAGAERIKGYTADEIIGRHFSVFYPREAIERAWPQQELEIAAREGKYGEHGWRLRKDGSRFWASVLITALRDDDGRLLGFSKITRDLTGYKEEEESLRSVVNNIVDGIITIDEGGTIKSFNPAAERIFGYSAQEVIGRNVKLLMPEHCGDDGFVMNDPRTADAKVIGVGREATGRRKDGSVFLMDLAVSTFYVAERRYFTGILRDITERKRAENELREAEERMRSVVNNVIDGIITIDEQGRIESFNPAAERIFGYAAAEMIGRNVKALMPEPYRSGHDLYLANYLRTGDAKVIGIGREVVGQRKDGTTFPMDLAVGAFHLDGRRYFTGIVRDITERQMLEQELRHRLEELAQADRHKNEFLAMLAHELRNPLAPIRNALHILKMPDITAPAMQQARSMMERQVQQMVRLVDDLLDVSRIMQGKIDLRMEQVDLVTVISHAVETAQPVIDAQGHELVVSLPPTPVMIRVDVFRLAQVISNLLTNAAKYTAKAGRIWLTAECEGAQVAIRVKDDGVGIAPELLPRVFDLFVQADRSLAHSQGGLGVGLTLVKKLVQLHGGNVEAYSDGPGRGSEFIVRLAVACDDPRDCTSLLGTGPPAAQVSRRILIVDDNVDAAESAAMLLRMWGHEARTVHDGRSVLGAAREFRPEIILLDIGLPVMTGYDVARELRAHGEFDGVVLAAMTGYGQYDDQLQSREAGFQVHLTKPLDPQVLEDFVQNPHAYMAR